MILVDSSVWIALADAKDQWHKPAQQLTPRLESEDILVTELIVAEAVTVIGRRGGGKEGMQMYHYFSDNCEIVYGDEQRIRGAMEVFLRHDGVLSLSDAFSVSSMKERGIAVIASFDSDFDKVDGVERVSKAG